MSDQNSESKSGGAVADKKRRPSKKEILFICAFSVMLVFNYFVFNQLDIILQNQAEFGILIKEVIGVYIVFLFITLAVVISALLAVLYFFRKIFPTVIAVLTGFVISGYVQVLFLNNTDIMNVNGYVSTSAWNFILNTLIHLIIIAAPVILLKYVINKKENAKPETTKPESGGKKEKSPQKRGIAPKIALGLAAIVFGMQAIGLISAVPAVAKPAKDNELYYFSIDKQLELSKNDNIIVFVLDRNDTEYVDTIFEEYPENKDIFSGFTYYRDSIAQYPGTFPSVAAMLSGKAFDSQQTQTEFMQDAWQSPVLFDALRANNYKINGLLNSVATVHDFKEIEDKFDNIEKVEKGNRRIKHGTFFVQMLKSALHRQSPYALKGLFVGYIETINKCVEIKNTPDYYSRTILPDSDLRFYDRLTDVGLSAAEDKNVFNFVHLLASHNPYGYDHNLKLRKSDNISQTRGTYKILDEYFGQMKDLGIFDSSTIIVMADHGRWNTLKNRTEMKDAPMAALFIKEKGADGSAAMETDNDAQMSHSNFLPTIIEVLYQNNTTDANQTYLEGVKEDGFSYFDVKKPTNEGGLGGIQTRYYYQVMWTNMNSTKYWWTYRVEGSAHDIKNWHKIK